MGYDIGASASQSTSVLSGYTGAVNVGGQSGGLSAGVIGIAIGGVLLLVLLLTGK
jgi:hypothetical protein